MECFFSCWMEVFIWCYSPALGNAYFCLKKVPGGVNAAKGFKATGMYGGLRAKGEKPDLALVLCDVDATAAGVLLVFCISVKQRYCFNLDINNWKIIYTYWWTVSTLYLLAFCCWILPGTLTTNVVAAAPVIYCRNILDNSTMVCMSATVFLLPQCCLIFVGCSYHPSLYLYWQLLGSCCADKCRSSKCCNSKLITI